MTRTLAEVMASVRHVLLDFDGPVCSVFGDLPAAVVARRLAEAIDADLPDEVIGTDPLALLSVFAERGRDTLLAAEAKLTKLETEAVRTAPITPGVVEALEAFRNTGRTVTIVSNNSQAAVETFVADRGLGDLITGVCSRQHPEPELLKPNPFLLRRALIERDAVEEDCVMVGDSTTDVRAAHACGVPTIALATKAAKWSALSELDQPPSVIIDSMTALEGLDHQPVIATVAHRTASGADRSSHPGPGNSRTFG